jgi:sensor histidine kinase regulating citrate/malate metabolism
MGNISLDYLKIIFIIIFLFVLFLIYIKIKYNKLLKKYNLISQQIINQDKTYKDMEIFQKNLRTVWHDFHNHIICIKGMLLNKDYEKIEDYLSKLCNFSKDEKFISTSNIIFDSILNEKKFLAKNNNINFSYKVALPTYIKIEPVDLCSVLGNILDNSIEACLKIKDDKIHKYIKLNVGYKNDFIHISLENSSNNKIKNKNGVFTTSKKEKYNHGIGLKNVEAVVLQYNGNISPVLLDNSFKLLIIMKNDDKYYTK